MLIIGENFVLLFAFLGFTSISNHSLHGRGLVKIGEMSLYHFNKVMFIMCKM
jgi:hypothetical protein